MPDQNSDQKELDNLIALIKKLRAPDGCPWDRKQKKEDIGKYILEEAYEVVDSLENEDPQELKEELGDLLFQIIFLAEMGKEAGQFSLVDVMAGISEKMIRRHPHIFGEKKEISVAEVKKNWQQIKKIERGTNKTDNDLFGNIPRSLPALKRAQKITKEASQYGFDWQSADEVLDKLKEELAEFIEARKNNDQNKIAAELGDLFFTLVNLSRFTEVDAEMSLTRSTNKFLQRFSYIIARLEACGKSLDEATLADMDALWNEAKKLEDIKK